MTKYNTLLTILDQIRAEAPADFKRYHPQETKVEELNNARSRAFIHLFLKVKFGLTEFLERERCITDDPQDGGIDGYYLDNEHRRIYLIQSKFRTKEKNFREKEILLTDLLKMDADRITQGHEADENDVPYNAKILTMARLISEIPDIARWDYEVVILANVSAEVSPKELKRLTGGYKASTYNHAKAYRELVFPVIEGTYYNPNELRITINLSNAGSQNARVTYKVATSKKECDITLIFVPTFEIARAMYKYRNAILKFNPRSYLELNNEVNREIANSIENIPANEFALFNNGITMLSFGTDFNERIGQKDRAQLIITQPQILNGGQTAFTLSRLYENLVLTEKKVDVFNGKEVLLKIITFHPEDQMALEDNLGLIEAISKATNQQSQVSEADRRSNDQIQVQLQNYLFDSHGLFYERKRGEYADGVRARYIQRSQIVDRDIFLRICKCCDMQPADARRMGQIQLFEREHFATTLADPNRFEEYFTAYQCFTILNQIKRACARNKDDKFGIALYGNGLQFGFYAVVSACMMNRKLNNASLDVNSQVSFILDMWIRFEDYAIAQSHNSDYFRVYKDVDTGEQKRDLNFNNYYKGRTVATDLQAFFAEKRVVSKKS